jgi:hypothetical protein
MPPEIHMSEDYSKLPALRDVYLEDSWVLDIRIDPLAVEFRIEFVLTENHPSYSSPRPGQQHCYRAGTLRFDGVRRVCWTSRGAPPATDASGESDFGNIDSFECEEDHRYTLIGDWGHMVIEASSGPVVALN